MSAVPTANRDMPRTGIATYAGAALAIETTGRDVETFLIGSLEASADFNTGMMNADVTLANMRSPFDVWGTVTMSDLEIANARFSGTNVTSSNGHSGSVKGEFMGPAAVEFGGVFVIEGPSTVRGSIAGRQQ